MEPEQIRIIIIASVDINKQDLLLTVFQLLVGLFRELDVEEWLHGHKENNEVRLECESQLKRFVLLERIENI